MRARTRSSAWPRRP
ncbi:hypothetical protein HaLaN_30288, partial [Haematococcus lacustris]